jgi:4-coumarate--CoA ligase
MIHGSPFAAVSVPHTALTPFALRHSERLAGSPALIEGATGRTLTYGELGRAVRTLAGGLVARGFRPGDVLALMAPNVPEYAVIFHGTAWAGGTVTTVNPTYPAGEVRHQLQDSGATLLVTAATFTDVATVAARGTGVREIVTIDPGAGRAPLAELMGAPLADQAAVDPSDSVALPYSSGTTGLSKGVVLSHHNLVANLLQTAAAMPIAEGETVLAFLPFFHIYGMQVLMNGALCQGGQVVTMPRFDLEIRALSP